MLIPALIFALYLASAQAREIAGVPLAQTQEIDGKTLLLNGAGVRQRFFFDVYVIALYLPAPAHTTEAVLSQPGPNRVLMHFLRDVTGDQIKKAWREGFASDNTPEALDKLRPRAEQFDKVFEQGLKKGEVVLLDYLPGTGTRVTIGGNVRATIPGEDFHSALMRVWIGKKPVSDDLKHELLGK